MPQKKTMRAAQIVAFKQPYEVRDVPIPTPGPGELLIKSGAAGFCHTDLVSIHMYKFLVR
jgi:propanol-preferring alcohol dehydrogenase